MARDARHPTILVADDNPDILGHVRALLEISGYAVIAASDGEEALRVYEHSQSQISLLLTDVAMPKINGFDLADRVLCANPQLPVFLCPETPGARTGAWNASQNPFGPPNWLRR
jgi:CheY-like chemotaxis protein